MHGRVGDGLGALNLVGRNHGNIRDWGGQDEGEDAAPAEFTFGVNVPTHQLGKPPRNHQAEPRPPEAAGH